MSAAVAASPRAACTVQPRDIVTLDGQERVVDTTRGDFSSPAAPRVILAFLDGGACRVHAGTQLTVERPA